MSPALLLLALPARADACDCVPGVYAELLTPADGATNVPRNTRIWFFAESVDLFVPGLHAVLEPPSDVEATIDTSYAAGGIGPVVLEFDRLLPAGTVVSTRHLSGATWTTFTVSDQTDDTPPTWDGAYDVETTRQSFCGPSGEDRITHHIQLHGISDDSGTAVVAWARPRKYGKDAWTGDDEFWISNSVCGLGEPTLADDPNRTYDLELFDAAGNHTTDAGKVRTGGCSTSPVPVTWAALAALLVARRGPRHPVR